MFNKNFLKLNQLLLTMQSKYVKLNYKNIVTGKVKDFNINTFFFNDISHKNNKLRDLNFIRYTLMHYKNMYKLTLSFINLTKLPSLVSTYTILNWYERETQEYTNIKFVNSLDTRNLILPYSFKLLNSSYKYKQRIQWVFTDIKKKKVTTNDKIKIIL